MQHRRFQAGLLQCTVEWRTDGDFRQTTAHPEQPGQSRLLELWSRQAAASLATLASDEAAGHLQTGCTDSQGADHSHCNLSQRAGTLRCSDAPMLVVLRIHTELARHAFSVAAQST